jgi:hypothetical protein
LHFLKILEIHLAVIYSNLLWVGLRLLLEFWPQPHYFIVLGRFKKLGHVSRVWRERFLGWTERLNTLRCELSTTEMPALCA